MTPPTRLERDSMGEMSIPADAYYGASTARAIENFPISSLRFPRRFIAALGLIKSSAAHASHQLHLLTDNQHTLIQKAASEIIAGHLDSHFPLDIFQTGSGTSTNMNANEVLATRANELSTGQRHTRSPIHPNDHVNMQQSSNDVIPTAIHIAAALAIRDELIPSLTSLESALNQKSLEFKDIIKIGRTHLQDATPITLAQEFSGYCTQAQNSVERANRALTSLLPLPLGGTAVGTGINSHPDFAQLAISQLSTLTNLPFTEAHNHFEAQSAKDAIVETSGLLKTIAISLAKIANDIRLLAAGPRCNLAEINLPATQPGSSIMPGKVNPVMSEMLLQVTAQVLGNDTTITFAASPLGSTFELNTMMPVIAYNLLQSISLLATSSQTFAAKCVAGITPNPDRCAQMVEQSLSLCTSLAPLVGYDTAADIAKQALHSNRTIRQIATEKNLLPPDDLQRALDPRQMLHPHPNTISSAGG